MFAADLEAAIRSGFPGGVVVSSDPVLDELVAAGWRLRRRASVWSWDFARREPSAQWAQLVPAPPLRLDTALGRTPDELTPVATRAYPPGHPDGDEDPHTVLASIIDDEVVGPLLPPSAVVIDGAEVVACLLLTDKAQDGPWVSEIFRHPAARYAGLGSLLLRRALRLTYDSGSTRLGLAVTAGNPAEQIYERIGFACVWRGASVHVPAEGEPP